MTQNERMALESFLERIVEEVNELEELREKSENALAGYDKESSLSDGYAYKYGYVTGGCEYKAKIIRKSVENLKRKIGIR